MTVKDRIEMFIERKGIKRSAFEKSCGLSNGYIRNLKENPSVSKIEDILRVYPELNRVWLLSGEGEMLKPNSSNNDKSRNLNETIGTEPSKAYIVPLVPMAAMGGELVGFEEDGVRDEDCEKVISPVSGASFAVPIYGDSMEPEYPNGSRVFVKQINPSDFIAWGNAYVLDTTNGIILKIVMESDNPNAVRCVSLNPSGRYQPFDVPKRTIRGMYRVLACVTAKG